MIYRIANSLIEIKGLQNEYLEYRLGAYLVSDTHAIPDITVTFIHNEQIEVPDGRDFNRLDTWYWIDRGELGYSAIKQEETTRYTMNRMDFNKSCSEVTIEYVDIDGAFIDFSTECDRILLVMT